MKLCRTDADILNGETELESNGKVFEIANAK
jgi:hypothetical protein